MLAQRIRANLTQARFALVILAIGVCAFAAAILPRRADAPALDGHRQARQLVLYYTLSRVDDPIVVLGDSIVEASTLPRSLCGHPVVNAGLNGASTASDLGNWLAPALGSKRASAIFVSLGTNDALVQAPISKQAFEDRYAALLSELAKLTTHLFVLGIPPVEARERMTADMQREALATIDAFNSILPGLAQRFNATFLALPAMPSLHTIDGVHLNSEGYRVWDKTITEAISPICG